jgi:hypothetical protein
VIPRPAPSTPAERVTEPMPAIPPRVEVFTPPPQPVTVIVQQPERSEPPVRTSEPYEGRARRGEEERSGSSRQERKPGSPPMVALPPSVPESVRKPEVPRVEEPKTSTKPKTELKASTREEKSSVSPPSEPISSAKVKEYNGLGRRHNDDQIDEILDEYLMSGDLPTYVSDRQRRDYRKHKRLPLRRMYLEQAGIDTLLGAKEDSGNVLHLAERKAQRTASSS